MVSSLLRETLMFGRVMPRDDVAGLRARKRRAACQHIEDCALRAFSERGFDDVTAEQICAAAGVSPATFYRYSGAKEEVIFAYRDDFLAALRVAISGAGGESPPARRNCAVSCCGSLATCNHRRARWPCVTSLSSIWGCSPGPLRCNGIGRVNWPRALPTPAAWRQGICSVPAGDLMCQLHAAIGLAVLRVALRQWRVSGHTSSLPTATSLALAAAADFAAACSGPGDAPGKQAGEAR